MKTKSRTKILIVDDEAILRNLLVRFIRKIGYEPIETEDGEKAIELFRLTHPEVVISDVMMPKMDGITLLSEIKKIDPQVIMILMTGFGNEDMVIRALRGGATNFFKKPFNFNDLADVINTTLKYKSELDTTTYASRALVEEIKKFEIETTQADIYPIINQICVNFRNVFPDSEIINLKIGIEEMLTNAIEHGNLGITYEEKNKAIEKGTFGRLLEQRMKEKNNQQKKIYLHSRLNKDHVEICIRDEGKGFNWRSLSEPSPENLLSYNGRGIFLTKIFYDEVKFNERGNEVVIVKRRKEK